MANYLNTNESIINFNKLLREKFYIDKSEIISEINGRIDTTSGYICVTRPRRFGKTSVVDMLGSYYGKGETKEVFDKLNISEERSYEEHLNKYNVIRISFNHLSDRVDSYQDYIGRVQKLLTDDLYEAYPKLRGTEFLGVTDMLKATEDRFIFLIDEWDYIFNNNLFKENQNNYLEFLRNLLKDRPYVMLVYMTGVLPIKKYSSGSALNMFDEFTFLKDRKFGEYFGFTEDEVLSLCKESKGMSFDEISNWYNGYVTSNGVRIYNPRSVVKALQNNHCESYSTNTGAMDEVVEYLKYNILEVREDIVEMISGEEVEIDIEEEFRAGQGAPKTKEEIYSAMIILGFLAYHEGYLKIPNKELMIEFEKAIKDEAFGSLAKLIENSRDMLSATVNKDIKRVEKILHDIHNSEIPIFQYNDENSLSCVITLAYLTARDKYRIEREEKTGKGFADFTFHPRRKRDIPFIVELKKNQKPEIALEQIRSKEYVEKFRKENEDKNILAVAICYDTKSKEHNCLIEEL
ncbi:MAG: AAA family ATPase [Sarcina sp.]